MIRLLTNIPLPVHILLLVIIPLLRLPGFDVNFLRPEESLYLLTAKQLANGGHLYTDMWHAGPPMMIGLVRLMQHLFGDYTQMALRIFGCLYLYLSAVYFNGIFGQHKSFRKSVGLRSVLFVILACVPWFAQEIGGSLIALLPVCIAFYLILQMGDDRKRNDRLMFWTGLWLMIGILVSYHVLFLWLAVMVLYLVTRTPRLHEFMSLVGGMLVVLLGLSLFLFFNGNLYDFWQQGVMYYLDHLRLSGELFYSSEIPVTSTMLFAWGGILLLAGIGFLHFRIRFFSYVAQVRTAETVMLIWTVCVSLLLFFKWKRLLLPDFILLIPPLVFYASKTFELRWMDRLRPLVLVLGLATPLYMHLSYLGLAFPDGLGSLRPGDQSTFLHGGYKDMIERTDERFAYLNGRSAPNGIWVLDHQPEIYLSLDQNCQLPWLDFRMAYYRLPVFRQRQQDTEDRIFLMWSGQESETNFYRQFREKPADYLLDPADYFSYLQNRYPNLFGDYREVSNRDGWKIYAR
ncbi:MAG: hypothetical protein AAF206_09415 [Bacteroidota bacterium]